jgi:hypothetical protein
LIKVAFSVTQAQTWDQEIAALDGGHQGARSEAHSRGA